ncbi:MAG: hypothetical protein M1840_003788 [Geoglossum simile]|nr:MAG: hypothetical protein M1840_003788 [Geoglossum simile]
MDVASHSTDNHTGHETAQNGPEVQAAQPRQTRGKRRRVEHPHAKPQYSDEYRRLLNTTVADAAAGTVYDSGGPLPPNYIGASFWTAVEKERFFNALARCGKDDIQRIAVYIGTKTEVEVRAYMLLLQQGTIEKILIEPRQQMLCYADLPAALEISQDCCDVLEEAADALDTHQQRFEVSAEKEKWQDLWLLTQGVGIWVEDHMDQTKENQEEVVDILPEAELLKLETWLDLSERIFMNPAPPREHENWRSFATEDGETPSIRYTAFVDFYTLAVSITQRLVQATLFFAMSRLRNTNSKIFGRKPLVITKDVHAAIKVLGLKPDSREIWRGAARRCGLRVYQKVSELRIKTDTAEPLSYDEVEALLDNDKNSGIKVADSTLDFSPNVGDIDFLEDSNEDASLGPPPSSLGVVDSSDSWGSEGDEPESEARIHAAPESSEAIETSSSETTTPASEDPYADALDRQASLLEEISLWGLLGKPPPFPLNAEGVELPPRPKCRRRRMEELVDWRDGMGYRAEWEVMGPVAGNRGEGVSRLGKRGRDEGSEEGDSLSESSGSDS